MNKKSALRWGVVLALAIPIVYLAIQLVPVLFRGYETETALESTLADAVPANGVVVRSELPLTYSGNGVLRYLVSDGKRVAPDEQVAEAFAGAAQAQNQAVAERLDSEINMLNQSQAQGDAAAGSDVEQLLKQQQQGLYALIGVLDSQQYQDLAAAKTTLALATNKLGTAMGGTVDYAARVAVLTTQRDAALAAAGTPEYITAPAPGGYYSSQTDGLEQTVTAEALDAMSAADLAALAKDPGGQSASSAGKLITNYEWYYYCTIDLAQADRFISDGGEVDVEIDFEGTGAREIPATVVSVDKDETAGLAKVKLMCDYINADTVNLRAGAAQISFKRYHGVRIAQSAVHLVTDKEGVQRRGVFVKYGNIIQFKRISPLYENSDYVIVPAKIQVGSDADSADNEVLLYDEIIISGKDLYDGKLL